MRGRAIIIFFTLLSSVYLANVSASNSNTDYSTSQKLSPGKTVDGIINDDPLYFSIQPESNTRITFVFDDPDGQYLEFCVYDGDDKSDLINCYRGFDYVYSHDQNAETENYYVKITCSECELEGINNVRFSIVSEYTESTGTTQYVIVFGIAIIAISGLIIIRVKQNNTKKRFSLHRDNVHISRLKKEMEAAATELDFEQAAELKDRIAELESAPTAQSSVVQNITYNIQDSVIAGDINANLDADDN